MSVPNSPWHKDLWDTLVSLDSSRAVDDVPRRGVVQDTEPIAHSSNPGKWCLVLQAYLSRFNLPLAIGWITLHVDNVRNLALL
jgi:hypothetical protein